MLKSARFAAILSVLLSWSANAEILDEALNSFIGKEVDVEGHIGIGLVIMDDEALAFRDPSERVYPVILDAGRDTRKRLEGCKFAMFGGVSPCILKGKAEIEMDGSTVRLILFEATEIGPPTSVP